MSLLEKRKKYLEDDDLDVIYYKSEEEVAREKKRKLVEEKERIEAEIEKIQESIDEEPNEENNNRVDIYPSRSKEARSRNEGKNETEETFFINKPDQIKYFEDKYGKARGYGLTTKPKKYIEKGFYDKISRKGGKRRKTKRRKTKRRKTRKHF